MKKFQQKTEKIDFNDVFFLPSIFIRVFPQNPHPLWKTLWKLGKTLVSHVFFRLFIPFSPDFFQNPPVENFWGDARVSTPGPRHLLKKRKRASTLIKNFYKFLLVVQIKGECVSPYPQTPCRNLSG